MKKNSLVILVLVIFFSCEKQIITIEDVEFSKNIDKSNDFAFKVFNEELKSKNNDNILISPISIYMAMSMATNGANTTTLKEMENVLGIPVSDQNIQNKALHQAVTKNIGSPSVTLVNSLHYDPNRLNPNKDFIQTLKDYYNSDVKIYDFGQSEKAKMAINEWVKDNTKGKIDQIVQEIKQEDIAFLINALHFKADWLEAFDPKMTSKGDFNMSNGVSIKTDFVHGDLAVPFSQKDGISMVDLPFKDSTFSYSMIMFDHKNDFFDMSNYKSLVSNLRKNRVLLSFPKLSIKYENDLRQSLKNLGIKQAFEPNNADFTKLGTSTGKIFINQIRHKAVLEVDEKGAEGAAVTSIGFGVTSVPPVIRFDKPYYFVLRHVKTNAIIFIGKVNAQPK